MSVSGLRYYATYHGHDSDLLDIVHRELRNTHDHVVFLAGDSSLDNKYWFAEQQDALNGYEAILQPPRMKADVCYWLNREFKERGKSSYCCLNTAIEATSLNDRACCNLLDQDEFIRDNITEEDTLIVSVGGNDIALAPVCCTVINLLTLIWCAPTPCIEQCSCACPPNLRVDGGCLLCGLPGCLSGTLCGWPLGMGYFVDLFKNRVGSYVSNMVSKRKPKKVIICMIYFLDQKATGSWADGALKCMCYDYDPNKLQLVIRTVFRLATQQIMLPGTEVVAVPLYEALDGKNTKDYQQRVEPSPQGGKKMATLLANAILASPGCSAE